MDLDMAWYWYWLAFFVVTGGLYYGMFFFFPTWQKRRQANKEDKEPELIIDEDDDPVKNCPVCSKEMTKDSLNGIIVDRCAMHGIWFDKGELKSVVNFVKTGGNVDGFFSGIGVDQ